MEAGTKAVPAVSNVVVRLSWRRIPVSAVGPYEPACNFWMVARIEAAIVLMFIKYVSTLAVPTVDWNADW
jgi:hypothetical protein